MRELIEWEIREMIIAHRRDLGLQVNQLEMDVQHETNWNAHQRQSELLAKQVYSYI